MNYEHYRQIRKGVEVWNQWRIENITIRADLRKADLIRADLSGASLGGAALGGAILRGATLRRAALRRATLDKADLSKANLRGADLREANLRGAVLKEANLSLAKLGGADLTGADLTGAILGGANLRGADLRRATLSFAKLGGADLSLAKLAGADLARADLTRADLSGADLSGADLREVEIGWTVFGDVDLQNVIGLEILRHIGPSTIGIDTLYRSHGKIPEVFLKGAGIPEDFIAYIPSLIGALQPIQFYSCFISYSTKDDDFARRLYADLQAEKVRCWFAPHDMRGGAKIHEQIDMAIRIHERLLLIVSENSMASEWVKTEIRKARKREIQEHRQVLFPVRLIDFEAMREWEAFDADTGKDMAVEVREYHVPDFSRWKDHDSYRTAFARLLKDLQASAEQSAGV